MPYQLPTAAEFLAGQLLLVDKPAGYTSFDVVNKLRYRLRKLTSVKRIKVGHSGTLDPMATGLLLVATGKATKRLTELTGLPKSYSGTIRFGESTPSYDGETEADARYPTGHLTRASVEAKIREEFEGVIEQKPPIYSAIKVGGKRAYRAARAGQTLDLPTRRVRVSGFVLHRVELPEVDFSVDVSKGTYIRSLAHDLGRGLGSGAYLQALRRTRIGEFSIDRARPLGAYVELLDRALASNPDT